MLNMLHFYGVEPASVNMGCDDVSNLRCRGVVKVCFDNTKLQYFSYFNIAMRLHILTTIIMYTFFFQKDGNTTELSIITNSRILKANLSWTPT